MPKVLGNDFDILHVFFFNLCFTSSLLVKKILRQGLFQNSVLDDPNACFIANPAAMRLLLRRGWEWNENQFWSFGFAAQSSAILSQDNIAFRASESLLKLVEARNPLFFEIHPVVVLSLFQRFPSFDASLRQAVSVHGSDAICGTGTYPRLRAWLLNHLRVESVKRICTSEFGQALFSWHLVRRVHMRKAAEVHHGYVWRRHTHRFLPEGIQLQGLFVLWILKQAFPKADRRLREHIVAYVMSNHWFERPIDAIPKAAIAFNKPHEILAPLFHGSVIKNMHRRSKSRATLFFLGATTAAIAAFGLIQLQRMRK